MSTATIPAAGSASAWKSPDFSLVLGGPLFQVLRRTHLSDDALGYLHRRILFAVLVTWAPVLALTAAQGGLTGPPPGMPLFDDIGFHLRFLVVVPLLIVAELIVHLRMRPIIEQFRARNLVPPDQIERFADALSEAATWRNSVLAEVLLIGFVYAVGIFFTLRRYVAFGGDAWFSATSAGDQLSLAGWWLVFVSLPFLQFLLLRWYFRLFIWARFLWRVSRLRLDLNATHPDKAGGLGFLADSLSAFVPIAMAHGALSAGVMANRIFFAGAQLADFQIEVFAEAVFLVLLFAGPLAIFAPLLARTKRIGLREYGALGQSYVREFRDKWLGGKAADEPLVGSGDIQSLADFGNSFGTAEQMRIAPIRPTALLYFVLAFLVPILPLLLTVMSPAKLIGRMVDLVF